MKVVYKLWNINVFQGMKLLPGKRHFEATNDSITYTWGMPQASPAGLEPLPLQ